MYNYIDAMATVTKYNYINWIFPWMSENTLNASGKM